MSENTATPRSEDQQTWAYEEDTGQSASQPLLLLNDPWAAVTTAAPSAASGTPKPVGSTPQGSQRGGVASWLPLNTGRFTRGRIAAFVAVVLAVVLGFGGAVAALAHMTGATSPTPAPPTRITAAALPQPTPAATRAATSTQTTTTPSPVAAAMPSPATSPPAPGPAGPMTITDSFARTSATGWGSVGGVVPWSLFPSVATFSIANGQGAITATQPGQAAFYTAVLGDSTSRTVEARCTFALQRFAGGQANMGIVLRWQSSIHYYKAYLDGQRLLIIKNTGGQHTTIAAVPFPAQDGLAYTLRFRSQGGNLEAKAWQVGEAEPALWMIQTNDPSPFTGGQAGVRALLPGGDMAQLSLFQLTIGA